MAGGILPPHCPSIRVRDRVGDRVRNGVRNRVRVGVRNRVKVRVRKG